VEPRVLWSHEFGDIENAPMSAQFAGAPAATFQVRGPAIERNGVVLGLGLSGRARPNLTVFGDAAAELRNGQSNVTFFLGTRYAW
jgi:outer membrane autotransporter protein